MVFSPSTSSKNWPNVTKKGGKNKTKKTKEQLGALCVQNYEGIVRMSDGVEAVCHRRCQHIMSSDRSRTVAVVRGTWIRHLPDTHKVRTDRYKASGWTVSLASGQWGPYNYRQIAGWYELFFVFVVCFINKITKPIPVGFRDNSFRDHIEVSLCCQLKMLRESGGRQEICSPVCLSVLLFLSVRQSVSVCLSHFAGVQCII